MPTFRGNNNSAWDKVMMSSQMCLAHLRPSQFLQKPTQKINHLC